MVELNKSEINRLFSALSADIRVKILYILHTEKQLPFSLLMRRLNLNPLKDAGTFSYHINSLIRSGLIEKTKYPRKGYCLTEIGTAVIQFFLYIQNLYKQRSNEIFVIDYDNLEKNILNVSFLKNYLSDFKIPKEQEQNIITSFFDRISQLNVREIPIDILKIILVYTMIDKEIPLNHILNMLMQKDEYTCIRSITYKSFNANLSSSLKHFLNRFTSEEINALFNGLFFIDTQFPKPLSVSFDLMALFDAFMLPYQRESLKSLKSLLISLATIVTYDFNVCDLTLNNFNFQIAPLISNLSLENLKEILNFFLQNFTANLYNIGKLSLNLSFELIGALKKEPLANIYRKIGNNTFLSFDDYLDEANLFIHAIIDSIATIGQKYPLLSPQLVFKITNTLIENDYTILDELYNAMSQIKVGNIVFSNIGLPWQQPDIVYTYNVNRLSCKKDSGSCLDLNNTIILNDFFINIPRIAYESNINESLIYDKIDNLIKTIFELSQKMDLIKYSNKNFGFRLLKISENAHFIKNQIVLVGINEGIKILTGYWPWEDFSAMKLLFSLLNKVQSIISEINENLKNLQFIPSIIFPPTIGINFAIKDYNNGFNRDKKGKQKYNIYTSTTSITNTYIPLRNKIKYESLIQPKILSGILNLNIIDLAKRNIFKSLITDISKQSIGAFAINKDATYCLSCGYFFDKKHTSCPRCRELINLLKIEYFNGAPIPNFFL